MQPEIVDRIRSAGTEGEPCDTEVILVRAHHLRRRRTVSSVALPALVAIAVIGIVLTWPGGMLVLSPGEGDAAEEVENGPFSTSAVIDPTLIVLEPARARPGTLVTVAFPQGTMRGVCFSLELDVAGQWDARYVLHSSPGTAVVEREPSWSRLHPGAVVDCPDVDVTAPDPDHVRVPTDAIPGRYRLCSVSTPNDVCAELDVTGD
jgi:hypothetical protein